MRSEGFQHFVDLGTVAAFFMNNDNREPEEDDLEMMPFFFSSEEQLSSANEDPFDQEFSTCICDLLDAFDNTSTNFTYEQKCRESMTNYMQHSIPALSEMMFDLMCYSGTSANENALLDTGAPRTICCEDWLRKANWTPLKKIALGPNTKPFL